MFALPAAVVNELRPLSMSCLQEVRSVGVSSVTSTCGFHLFSFSCSSALFLLLILTLYILTSFFLHLICSLFFCSSQSTFFASAFLHPTFYLIFSSCACLSFVTCLSLPHSQYSSSFSLSCPHVYRFFLLCLCSSLSPIRRSRHFPLLLIVYVLLL
jgi:hypothetical protein